MIVGVNAPSINEQIICSAVWFQDGKEHEHQPKNINTGFVIAGRRHHNCYYTMAAVKSSDVSRMDFGEQVQGFLTNTDRFVTREEAAKIAYTAKQIMKETTMLFSEDLY